MRVLIVDDDIDTAESGEDAMGKEEVKIHGSVDDTQIVIGPRAQDTRQLNQMRLEA